MENTNKKITAFIGMFAILLIPFSGLQAEKEKDEECGCDGLGWEETSEKAKLTGIGEGYGSFDVPRKSTTSSKTLILDETFPRHSSTSTQSIDLFGTADSSVKEEGIDEDVDARENNHDNGLIDRTVDTTEGVIDSAIDGGKSAIDSVKDLFN